MLVKSLSLLFLRLQYFLNKSNCHVYSAPFDLTLFLKNDKLKVCPNLCILNENKPILVAENLPKNNAIEMLKEKLHTKFDLYQEAGVQEYWIIDPLRRMVLLYSLVEGKLVTGKPFLEGDIVVSKIFPDFSVAVDDIFAE